jgi:hypothetical protein
MITKFPESIPMQPSDEGSESLRKLVSAVLPFFFIWTMRL